ncbi:MAG: hypothetical protein EXQ55_03660 [Acidobacteria bacterium]|nr:hypothetical protein [Acidobacteriota bacterium]
MIYARRLFSDWRTRGVVIDHVNELGWEISEEKDNQVVKRLWLRDWHRVENTMMRFTFTAMELERAGWTEIQAPASSVV